MSQEFYQCPICGIARLKSGGEPSDTEKLARWMIAYGFATGHGDSFEDLLEELGWQVAELRAKSDRLEQVLPDHPPSDPRAIRRLADDLEDGLER